ncbi:MAG: helix-turn-helix transcriptional regulator [Rhodobacteraceae bacterium]|nr:helix-turn-helix transcriptional regulator [Paracoccaceae bacterium]
MDFAENLKEARRARNLTQKDLAKLSQLTQPQISQLEAGKNEPKLSTVMALSCVLGMSLDELTACRNSTKQPVNKSDQKSKQLAGKASWPHNYTGIIPIPERFHCMAEQRAKRFRIDLEYEDIGEELLLLRKQAYDFYGDICLWSVPGHATISGLRGIAGGLQDYGDLNAARLAAKILEKTEWDELIAP